MTTKVTLREKPISKGRKSLYLDFYPAITHPQTGQSTRREFLKLYIFEKARTTTDKQHNFETLKIAESIRQKKENLLNKPEIYSQFEKEQLKIKELGETNFVEYFKKLANKRKSSNYDNWVSALHYLEAFTNGKLKFADLNEKLLEDFKIYLLTTKSKKSKKTTLSKNSAVSYFNKVKATLKQAYVDGILQTDLNTKVKPIKAEETRRAFLTSEELNRLANTPIENKLLKRALLFSALTGLASKEIENLIWKDIIHIKDKGYLMLSKRQKTQTDNYLPISEQAYSLTEGNENPREMEQEKKIFDGLKYSAYQNKKISQWIKDAGITKKITFHNFRHTYATLQLFADANIVTISKMLGHKNLKTTMAYAKVVDEAKRKVVNNIQIDFEQPKE